VRTIAETKTDLSLNNVSNVATDDTTYNATSWNTNTDAATKNAIRDKVETMDTAIGSNTTHRGSDGSDHSIVGTNTTAIGLNTTHRGLSSGNPHSVTPTELSLVIGTNTQAWDAGLDSLAGLTYSAASFVKMTGANAFALRTIGETADDLEGTIVHDNLASVHQGVTTGDSPSFAGLTLGTGLFTVSGKFIQDAVLTTSAERATNVSISVEETANIGFVIGFSLFITHASTYQVTGNLTCLQASAVSNSSGLITLLRGSTYGVQLLSSGNATTAVALQVQAPFFTSTGQVTTNYGLRLQNQSHANVGTAYAIDQQGVNDINLFAAPLELKERAAAQTNIAGFGQIWVKNTNPCQLWFTDDLGNDTQIV
ncbi:hypothetical protein LCGC14_2174380, partial [marine sediment metagenome]